jgi:hypothetical protein
VVAYGVWLVTTYRRPADPSRVLPPFLLPIAAEMTHMGEEYLTDFPGEIRRPSRHSYRLRASQRAAVPGRLVPRPDRPGQLDGAAARRDERAALPARQPRRWDRLRDVLPALLFKRSFRSDVLEHFRVNGVAAMPVLDRLA